MGKFTVDRSQFTVWFTVRQFTVTCHEFAGSCPPVRTYLSASSQLSVGANLAEGSKRRSKTDEARIFNIADSEGAETMSILDLAVRLGLGRKEEAERLMACYEEPLKMLASLCLSLIHI